MKAIFRLKLSSGKRQLMNTNFIRNTHSLLFEILYELNKTDAELLKPKWYLHPSNELPSFSFRKIDEFDLKSANYYYDRIEFKYLLKPFETQCFD
jgi:hypothetical protein